MSRFLDYIVRNDFYPSAGSFLYHGRWLFRGIDLGDKTLLDIGCGKGLVPTYARFAGASQTTGIEPEADGAADGMLQAFKSMLSCLAVDGVEAFAETFEGFLQRRRRFDIVTMCQVVNHLNEEACIRLKTEPSARGEYVRVFRELAGLLTENGVLILTDCGQLNLFAYLARFGFRHPFVPSIEWHKHQEPRLWMRLLAEAGFDQMSVSWRTPNRLSGFERILSNRVAARCLTSDFRIVARHSTVS